MDCAAEEIPTPEKSPCVVIPPPDDDPNFLTCLENVSLRVGPFLAMAKKWNNKKLQEYGIRRIQKGRWEMFVEAEGKSSKAFDEIIQQQHRITKQQIISFCKDQAKKDHRTGHLKYYNNFSLICALCKTGPQFQHMDLKQPNFQFALIMTDDVAPTIIFKPRYKIETAQDLRQLRSDIPDAIIKAIDETISAKDLLGNYGNVLSPCTEYASNSETVSTGYGVSCPGDQVHAGPGCVKARIVMFWSGAPTQDQQYHADDQYYSANLLAEIIQAIWNLIDNVCRAFLLSWLADIVQQEENDGMAELLVHTDYEVGDLSLQIVKHGGTQRALEMLINGFLNEKKSMEPFQPELDEATAFGTDDPSEVAATTLEATAVVRPEC